MWPSTVAGRLGSRREGPWRQSMGTERERKVPGRFQEVPPDPQAVAVEGMLSALRPVLLGCVEGWRREGKGAGRLEPRYALRLGYRAWEVIFDGERAVMGDELGMRYAVYLLKVRPCELVHGTTLAGAVLGQPVVQEGDLWENQTRTVRRIEAEALEMKAVLDDPTAAACEQDQARRELARLAAARRVVERQPASGACKCAGAIRKSLWRLHDGLAEAPSPVLRAFAGHLKDHLLVPSSRYAGRRDGRRRTGVAGGFIYERPARIFWED